MQESPIFVKTDQMLLWLVRCTEKFPKSQRFKMAKRIEDAAFLFQEHIQAAATTRLPERLVDADVQLGLVKRRLRMAKQMELMSIQQFEHSTKLTAEVGRLLGAWSKREKG
jgi:hypothetical protein